MSFILLTAAVVHLPMLLMELPLRSYDTNFHIFFASHYLHHWFNPWNPKWFGGFSQTSYPPLPQQWTAVLSLIFGLNMGYMVVQFMAILLLAVGVYRFSEIWVSPRAASFAALGSVLLGSESFLVYNAGQLGTTAAAPLYLLALPFLYQWLRFGGWRSFVKALALFAAAAAAHHATLLFGSLLFALPILALALMDRNRGYPQRASAIAIRAAIIAGVVTVTVGVVLWPFWIWLFHNPVTQTPIPHPSRANYILSPEWGLNYFVVPYGALILALPFIILRGAKTPRLSPLMIGFWVCFLIGLGGTTPVGVWLLHRAFEVLTFERFSYWATLLALPIVGAICADLVSRFRMKAGIPLVLLGAVSCGLAAAWSTFRPTDDQTFKVDSVAQWLNRDGHDKYRYITLGFGNKLSRLAIETDADSVDGESNSSRTLPELTQYGGAALTSAKYFGPGGMESLRAVLHHAKRYGLRWVIVRDPYYDPLLKFTGWKPVDQLDNGAFTVWTMAGVPPATPVNVSQIPSRWQGIVWGTLPFGSSLAAILLLMFLGDDDMRHDRPEDEPTVEPVREQYEPLVGAGMRRLASLPATARQMMARMRTREEYEQLVGRLVSLPAAARRIMARKRNRAA